MTDQTVLKETSPPSPPPQGRAPDVKTTARGGRLTPRSLIVGALITVVAGIGLYFYVPGFWLVSTDDAYVNAHVVSIVPKVAAYVSKLNVNDNSKVARDVGSAFPQHRRKCRLCEGFDKAEARRALAAGHVGATHASRDRVFS